MAHLSVPHGVLDRVMSFRVSTLLLSLFFGLSGFASTPCSLVHEIHAAASGLASNEPHASLAEQHPDLSRRLLNLHLTGFGWSNNANGPEFLLATRQQLASLVAEFPNARNLLSALQQQFEDRATVFQRRPSKSFGPNLRVMFFDAYIATFIPTHPQQQIFINKTLKDIVPPEMWIENAIAQNPQAQGKEIDVAWIDQGRLFIVESKSGHFDPYESGSVDRIIAQSKLLSKSLSAVNMPTLRFLVLMKMDKGSAEHLKIDGAEYDYILGINQLKGL